MMYKSKRSIKTLLLLIGSFALSFTMPTKLSSTQIANASSSGIVYRRYAYSTGTTSDYTLYEADLYNASNARTLYPYNDNRIEDDDTSVVKLTFCSRNTNGNNISSYGTGFIVDKNIIATCAHCVYNRDSLNPNGTRGMFCTDYSIKIYDDNFSQPLATYSPVSVHIPITFINSTSEPEYSSYEYALLYLGENVDLSSYGIFHLGVANDSFLANNNTVKCSGFPGLVNGGVNLTGARYLSDGRMGEFDHQASINVYPSSCDKRFHATTVSSGGNSGGPVYTVSNFLNNEYHTVVGICSGASYDVDTSTGTGTYGVRITTDLLRFYYYWNGGRIK